MSFLAAAVAAFAPSETNFDADAAFTPIEARKFDAAPPYETRWFTQRADHFGAGAAAAATWKQRYLVNADQWGSQPPLANGCKGPILFYTGNEGPIDAFWGASGFVTTTLRASLGALVVFGEERYYGLSRPTPGFTYLSTENVLADYAALLISLRADLNATDCPVIAFGGSYGGTLTTLFRLKYPHVVAGGLAASAPLGYYAPSQWARRGVTPTTWFDTVVRDYTEAQPGCYDALVAAVKLANATARANASEVADTFELCEPPADVDAFVYWITEALESIPQIDYPEASGSLPGSPVNVTCAAVLKDVSAGLAQVAKMFYGYGGASGCAKDAANTQFRGGVPGDGPDAQSAWGYQSCTETLHQFSTPAGGWRSYDFDGAALAALCEKWYGVAPRAGWFETWTGGYEIAEKNLTSNLIWSNGRRDPWHGGGLIAGGDAVPGGAVFVMETTAHHQDLRLPTPKDPPELTKVRAEEEAIIRRWIAEAVAN